MFGGGGILLVATAVRASGTIHASFSVALTAACGILLLGSFCSRYAGGGGMKNPTPNCVWRCPRSTHCSEEIPAESSMSGVDGCMAICVRPEYVPGACGEAVQQ